jgi:uncharacterized membrane protein YphA (DoxX/SURF4 family)
LIEALCHKQGWNPLHIDSRAVSSIALRERFDEAYGVPEGMRGRTPALFYTEGSAVGYTALHAAQTLGLPRAGKPAAHSHPVSWGLLMDLAVIVLSLFVAGMVIGPYARMGRVAGALLLAAVFLAAGLGKVLHPAAFAQTVEQMGLFPLPIARASWLVGFFETGLGAALILPQARPAALRVAAVLLAGFAILSIVLLIRGYSGNCGCMPWASAGGWLSLLQDASLSALSYGLLHSVSMKPQGAGRSLPT